MNGALSQLEREAARILGQLRRLETLPVPSVAKLLRKSPRWVRENLPVIVEGPRSHRVRLLDIEEFQQRRTVWPQFNGKKVA